jgi:cellulose synthase (UDP-forming)
MKRILEKWKALGTASSLTASLIRLIVYALLLFLAYECITVDFNWPEQAVLGGLTILLTFALHAVSDSEMVTLALMFASMLATARYAYWRFVTVYHALSDPNSHLAWIDITFMLILLSAEIYAWGVLYLGYIQAARPLRRPPVPLPHDLGQWPHVDILIPTYNEPLSVVRSTAFAALNIDYPSDKMHVYVLDDGRRENFKEFCAEAGIGYVIRPDNKHAKAGNINHALKSLTSPYVAIFDCDHVPTRSFLQVTLGWFLKDKKLGMLQTPHFFYSPDPFERNLDQFKVIPNEGELFYGILQDGNDLWNATFFCGSCAVLRRTALDQIGGIATETVTEDAHTSLRMQMLGWGTAYINIPQAGGLATESLSSHVGQRIRWARGMIQILRTDCPLFVKGLKWPQRICYFNAMIHFLYAVPRLVFLTAPLVFILLGRINIPGYWIAILAYALPHLFLSNVTNFRVQGKYRYSFWNEVYETILAPYILGPTIFALINPKLGKFNVTAKGGIVKESNFDFQIARPYILMLLLNIAGLIIVPIRIFYWNSSHPGTIAMNAVWILFNMVIIGTANAVAMEARQLRKDVRLDLHMPVEVKIPGRPSVFGESLDMSIGGSSLILEEPLDLSEGATVEVIYPLRDQQAGFKARVIATDGLNIRIHYGRLSLEEEEMLTLVLFSGADTWLSRMESRQTDRPMRSFGRLMKLSVRGIGYALMALIPGRKARRQVASAGATAAMVLAMLAGGLAAKLHALPKKTAPSAPAVQEAGEGDFHTTFQLKDLGVPSALEFRGLQSAQTVLLTLPYTEVVQQGTLHLRYAFSPGLITDQSHLNVLLNGTLIATLPVPPAADGGPRTVTASMPLPGDLMVRNNALEFEFVGHYAHTCEDPDNPALWARVEASSSIELAGSLLPLADNLKQLPLPFYDSKASGPTATVPIAFGQEPDSQALKAAGIAASWFGVRAKSKPIEFPVTIGGQFPHGNFILLVDGPGSAPAGLDVNITGPVVAERTNPSDPFGKVLVIAGTNSAELLTAARALALEQVIVEGKTAPVSDLVLPPERKLDDSPLWLSTQQSLPLWQYSDSAELQSQGSSPIPVYVRVPPDLYYGDRTDIALHIDYTYNAAQTPAGSFLRIAANGATVGDLPLQPGSDKKKLVSGVINIPIEDLRPFANTFLFSFLPRQPKFQNCTIPPSINVQGTLLRSSHLELEGIHHWATLPDIELFSNAGFPFTRQAGLSQTTVVVPARASAQEIGVYLMLLAYFGGQTGYPALRVNVGDSGALGQDVDYLVIGSIDDQPAFDRLNDRLPVTVNDGGFQVAAKDNVFSTAEHLWWQVAQMRPTWWGDLGASSSRAGLVASLSQAPDALIQQIESPWGKGRTIVSITLRDDDAGPSFVSAFLKASDSGDISQSVSVLHGNSFTSYRMGDEVYHIGHLEWWAMIRYRLRQFPWLIVVLTFILGMFVVPWARAKLDRRMHARLEAREI